MLNTYANEMSSSNPGKNHMSGSKLTEFGEADLNTWEVIFKLIENFFQVTKYQHFLDMNHFNIFFTDFFKSFLPGIVRMISSES
jgi:hypothetical protein